MRLPSALRTSARIVQVMSSSIDHEPCRPCARSRFTPSSARLESIPTLNLDGAPETNIEFPELARRDPLEHHMNLRTGHPPPGHDTVHIVPASRVVRLALNDRLERVRATRIIDFITSNQVRKGAIIDTA